MENGCQNHYQHPQSTPCLIHVNILEHPQTSASNTHIGISDPKFSFALFQQYYDLWVIKPISPPSMPKKSSSPSLVLKYQGFAPMSYHPSLLPSLPIQVKCFLASFVEFSIIFISSTQIWGRLGWRNEHPLHRDNYPCGVHYGKPPWSKYPSLCMSRLAPTPLLQSTFHALLCNFSMSRGIQVPHPTIMSKS
jgi:hypothetical protein